MMASRDLLKALNQRPIAYFPIYGEIMKSTFGGVLLSQLMYWFSISDKIYKTNDELISETHITSSEMLSAKRRLKQLDFIIMTREGIPAKTYYEIDWKRYAKTLKQYTSPRSTLNVGLDKRKKSNSTNVKRRSITETTTETTTENTKKKNTLQDEAPHRHGVNSSSPKSVKDNLADYQKGYAENCFLNSVFCAAYEHVFGVDHRAVKNTIKWHPDVIDLYERRRGDVEEVFTEVLTDYKNNKPPNQCNIDYISKYHNWNENIDGSY